MVKFSQRVVIVLACSLLLWVSASGVKVMAGDESAGRTKVLIIGDSVFDAFDHVESARELLDSQQKTIFAV